MFDLRQGSVCFAIAIAAAACGSSGSETEEGLEPRSDCTSADGGSELTYETFGRDFMTRYCVRCHSAELSSSQRNGAPSDHDFDTLQGIQATELEHIAAMAAATPTRVGTLMPPNGDMPSRAEREALGAWLACGAP
jgi:hypothetical protein